MRWRGGEGRRVSRPTCHGQLVSLTGDVEVEPPPPLCVVTAAQARHALSALLVHVHITGCNIIIIIIINIIIITRIQWEKRTVYSGKDE